MENNDRELVDYVNQYRSLPFEDTQLRYRRKKVIEQIKKFLPNSVLEVGCGEMPLFLNFPDISFTIVEPATEFVKNARELAISRSNVAIIESQIEEAQLPNYKFDMIVVSCLLHEVVNPGKLLNAVSNFCHKETILHVNVPNALSLHRLLAVSMGLISNVYSKSSTQERMQQKQLVYDAKSLKLELEKAQFKVIQEGSFFIKLFTHEQMQKLIDTRIISKKHLDGLYNLSEYVEEFGSEIWVNAQIKSK
jgi:ubiquinone/menaquinone biosynthesis C-methylase UbiE